MVAYFSADQVAPGQVSDELSAGLPLLLLYFGCSAFSHGHLKVHFSS